MISSDLLNTIPYLPNLIISGATGSGRRTIFTSMIQRLFSHPEEIKLTPDFKTIKVSESRTKEVLIYSSKLFYEINPSFLGIADYIPMQSLIKEIASTRQITHSTPFRIILILEAEKLSMQAQQGLRRTIEKYNKNARFVFITNNIDALKPALQSRCLLVAHSSPSLTQVKESLSNIDQNSKILSNLFKDKEKIILGDNIRDEIAFGSNRNYKLANKMAELYTVSKYVGEPVKDVQSLLPRWLKRIRKIALMITKNSNLYTITKVRKELQEMEASEFNTQLLVLKLTEMISANVDKEIMPIVFRLGSNCERRLEDSDKKIYQMEKFVVEIIGLLNGIKGRSDKKQFVKEFTLSNDY